MGRQKKAGAGEITPETILSGLLIEDAELLATVLLVHPDAAKELENALAATSGDWTSDRPDQDTLPLLPGAEKVVWESLKERERFGHGNVGTQHLLLALLGPIRRRAAWLGSRKTPNEIPARRVL